MFKLELPGWAVEERNAIDGTIQKIPIVFGTVLVGMSSQGPFCSLMVWIDVKGELVRKDNPKIVRVYDA